VSTVFTLLPSFWPPLGRTKRIAQFLPFFGNFGKFPCLSACRAKGLVEGFDLNSGTWGDALGVELTG
jgi:hypothetical protein